MKSDYKIGETLFRLFPCFSKTKDNFEEINESGILILLLENKNFEEEI